MKTFIVNSGDEGIRSGKFEFPSFAASGLVVPLYVKEIEKESVCVCACEREREREKETTETMMEMVPLFEGFCSWRGDFMALLSCVPALEAKSINSHFAIKINAVILYSTVKR